MFGRHLLSYFFLGDLSVGIAADGGKHIPGVSPDQIGRRHAATDLVVPGHTGLRAGMSAHCRTQIPFEGADIVAIDSKAERVHHADQLFGIGVAGLGGRKQFLHRFGIAAFLHQIATFLDLGRGRSDQYSKCDQAKGEGCFSHCRILLLFLFLTSPVAALAADLPEPPGPDDFRQFDEKQARLGRLLFFDPILSGNRNISCGTCHIHAFGSSDGLALGVGEGGEGAGLARTAGEGESRIKERMARNTMALWNVGAREQTILMHDGRISVSDIYGNGFNTPAEEWLPNGLEDVLAAQALFPMTSITEMAGQAKENEVAGAAYDRIDAVWPILAKRVRTIPEYGRMLVEAFDDIDHPSEATIVHIGKALGAFIGLEWQSYDSPFDAYLKGDELALDVEQKYGLELFYGKAGCSDCHSGKFLTDQKFHSLGLPQFGPGRTRPFDPNARDVGRMGESDRPEDAYRFRTPALRNVALTAPYGHNGAYSTLEGIIRHHADPVGSFDSWSPKNVRLPWAKWLSAVDFAAWSDRLEHERIKASIDIEPVPLSDPEIGALVSFLHSLTGKDSTRGRWGKPEHVPSGLKVD